MLSLWIEDSQPNQLQPQSRKDQNDDNDDGDWEEEHGEFLGHALEVLEQDDHHEDLDVQNLLDTH